MQDYSHTSEVSAHSYTTLKKNIWDKHQFNVLYRVRNCNYNASKHLISIPDQYLHLQKLVTRACVSWDMSGDCHWSWKASQCKEPGQQGRYQGYPSHGDVKMPSFSDIPLEHHLDQENLNIVRKRLTLKVAVRSWIATYHNQVMHSVHNGPNLWAMICTPQPSWATQVTKWIT